MHLPSHPPVPCRPLSSGFFPPPASSLSGGLNPPLQAHPDCHCVIKSSLRARAILAYQLKAAPHTTLSGADQFTIGRASVGCGTEGGARRKKNYFQYKPKKDGTMRKRELAGAGARTGRRGVGCAVFWGGGGCRGSMRGGGEVEGAEDAGSRQVTVVQVACGGVR